MTSVWSGILTTLQAHPITGHGGNGAIETATALTNALNRLLSGPAAKRGVTDQEITDVFTEVQAIRSERAKNLVRRGHRTQLVVANDMPLSWFLNRVFAPLRGPSFALHVTSTEYKGAIRLDMLDVPKQHRFIPYPDELPAKPVAGVIWPVRALFSVILVFLAFIGNKIINKLPMDADLTFAGEPLKRVFTGVDAVDKGLQFMVGVTSWFAAGDDLAARVQTMYFWALLLIPATIWTLDSYRKGAAFSLVSSSVTPSRHINGHHC